MALGGGTFIHYNKTLPGTYINFVNAARVSAELSERGVATMPLVLNWGAEGRVFTVTAEEFEKHSDKHFGYSYGSDELKGLRDLFRNIRVGHFYRLNGGGTKAANAHAEARYSGTRGNDLTIVIQPNGDGAVPGEWYDVSTWLDGKRVDTQTVAVPADLKANDYVTFLAAPLEVTAGLPLVGGTNSAVDDADYQDYLDRIESYGFHVMGCLSASAAVKSLLTGFARRMREECGVKFQTVLFRPEAPDYEGVIALENGLEGDKNDPSMVYWVTGAEAGCGVNRSLTNAVYTGSFAPDTDYTQAQLEAGIKAGKLMLHRVGDTARVLDDINSFVGATDEKSADFSANQTVRVLDQIGNDIAELFQSKYLGKVPNDEAGRISLWNDIVKHHQQLQQIRAIEDFSGERVTVTAGENKKSVVVTDAVTPVNAMQQLYMTVIVQ